MDRVALLVLGILGMLAIERTSEFYARQQNLQAEALRRGTHATVDVSAPRIQAAGLADMAAPGPDGQRGAALTPSAEAK